MNDSPKELKAFKKKLRENSKKYHKDVLEHALWKCELCGWGNRNFNCLQIHHICPVETYAGIFLSFRDAISNEFKNGMPDSRFEKANQIALCPNCHMLVHQFIKEAFRVKDFETHKGDIEDIIKTVEEYICQGSYDAVKIQKFQDIISGHLLGKRLYLSSFLKKENQNGK